MMAEAERAGHDGEYTGSKLRGARAPAARTWPRRRSATTCPTASRWWTTERPPRARRPRYGVRSAPSARRRRAARTQRRRAGAPDRGSLARRIFPLSKRPSSHGHSASASSAFTSSSPSRGCSRRRAASTARLRASGTTTCTRRPPPTWCLGAPAAAIESVHYRAHLGHRARGVERVAQRRVALERREHLEEVLLRVGEVRRVRLAHVEVLDASAMGASPARPPSKKAGFSSAASATITGAARRRNAARRRPGFHPAVGEHRDAQRGAHVGNRLPAAHRCADLLLLCAPVDGEQRAARVLQQPRVDRLIADQTDLASPAGCSGCAACRRPPEQIKLLEQEGAEAAALAIFCRQPG